MNNIGSNISAVVTVTLGVFGLENNEFRPTTVFFCLIGIAFVAFLVSFVGEWLQDKVWQWMQHKSKDTKKHGMGLGNRYF